MVHDVSMYDLVSSLSEAIDLISPLVADHNLQTAWIAFSIGKEMNLGDHALSNLVLASSLHDVGGLSLRDRLDALRFDAEDNRHGQVGAALLSQFPPFSALARIIREHHLPWEAMHTTEARRREPDLSEEEQWLRGILFLADRADVLIRQDMPLLPQAEGILGQLSASESGRFCPEALMAFRVVAGHEDFWMALESGMYRSFLAEGIHCERMEIGGQAMMDMFSLFSRIVDFRSPYTATHSAAVAACAGLLGEKMGFSDDERLMLEMAGYLHDLGKLSVPTEVLEKHEPLTTDEFSLMRGHPFLTGKVLRCLNGFEQVRAWSSQHHERVNGTGYPSRVQGAALPLGSRILAVADVFVALTEERPYRIGMSVEKAGQIMDQMVEQSFLDPKVMEILDLHREEMDELRSQVQEKAQQEYVVFSKCL